MEVKKKSKYILATVMVFYVFVVAIHKGEFWPFSIYPMFSKAPQIVSKTLVRRVNSEYKQSWNVYTKEQDLPGTRYILEEAGIDQNDLSTFVQKTEMWDSINVENISQLLSNNQNNIHLVLYEVHIELANSKKLEFKFFPLMSLYPDSTVLNPNLEYNKF
jgi:hypothetical protein